MNKKYTYSYMRYFLAFLFIISPFRIFANEQFIDWQQIFHAAPFIYIFLFFLSVSAAMIYLYALFSSRYTQLMSKYDQELLTQAILNKNHELALEFCEIKPTVFNQMVSVGIQNRKFGYEAMIEMMKSTGKRATSPLWQKVSLLNDIAIISPMLGLLGTVAGMFAAFYNPSRSIDSLNILCDGLGISVGTTLAGLIIAILAMILSTLLKHRLLRSLTNVETAALLHIARLVHESHS